jgi:hypothetical protein
MRCGIRTFGRRRSVAKAEGFTFEFVTDLAKGFLKKQVEEYTGVKL